MEPNPFTKIEVTPGFGNGHHIQWSIDPTFIRSEVYNFFVEISGTLRFDELLDEIAVGNSFFYVDKSNRKQNIQDNYFYRIRLEVGNEVFLSNVSTVAGISYTRRQYVIAAEIARKEVLRASKYTGGPYYLLKLRTYGTNITDDSVDPISGVALTTTSPSYGNSKLNGYYNAVKMYMSIDDSEDTRKLNPDGSGVIENQMLTTRVAGFPIIDTNDVLVDLEADARYMVRDRQNYIFPGTSLNVVQNLKINLLPPTDPIYTININDE